jgi:predicted permease
MGRLIFSISLVIFGIGAGYLVQVVVKKHQAPVPIDMWRRTLQKTALLFLNPVAILGATWVADIQNIRIAALPFLGATALFTGGILAFFSARMLHLNSLQTGSYIVCGGFTNIGSLGALFCFIFLGEKGFALVPFYKLFEESLYYAVGFPIAKSFSQDATETPTFVKRLATAVTDPFVLVAVSSIATGLVLNLFGIPRPEFYGPVNTVFIPLAAFLLLISIGMAMRFSSMHTYFKPGLIIAAIKFLIIPFVVAGTGYALGLGRIDDGLPLKVVMILSAMPVGFIAMVPPTLYNLDVDLANACWLITNAGLLLVIPVLFFLI